MSEGKENILKYNQFGFCKFKEHCKTKDEHRTCESRTTCKSSCTKRQTKDCGTFSNSGQCRFNEQCSYKHVEKVNQSEINGFVTQLMGNMKQILVYFFLKSKL